MTEPSPKRPHLKPHVRKGTLRQKAWRAMQIKGKFTLADLCRAVLTGEEADKNPKNNIGRYVTRLARAGVLVEMRHRAAPTSLTSNGEKRWLLVKDLGRTAPVLRENGAIWDPNGGREMAHD